MTVSRQVSCCIRGPQGRGIRDPQSMREDHGCCVLANTPQSPLKWLGSSERDCHAGGRRRLSEENTAGDPSGVAVGPPEWGGRASGLSSRVAPLLAPPSWLAARLGRVEGGVACRGEWSAGVVGSVAPCVFSLKGETEAAKHTAASCGGGNGGGFAAPVCFGAGRSLRMAVYPSAR